MPAKILVIDNDTKTLTFVQNTFSAEQFQLTVTQSGIDGIKLAQTNPPDLLILDVTTSDMDGFDVCKQFRETPELAQVPIIMFTAKFSPTDKATGFLIGADDYIVKPTTPKRLRDRVQAHLSNATSPTQAVRPEDKPVTKKPSIGQSFIGVLGVRGGVGTTMVTINLACGLARSGHSTILADFDQIQGHVGLYLNKENNLGLNRLANTTAGNIDISSLLTLYESNLSLLLFPSNITGKKAYLEQTNLSMIGQALSTSNRTVFADLGRGITPLNSPLLDYLNHLVLCLCPDRLSILATSRLLNDLKTTLPDTAFIHLLLLNYDTTLTLPKEAIEKKLQYPLTDIIFMQYHEIAQAANEGVPIIYSKPTSLTSEKFRSLAYKLVTV